MLPHKCLNQRDTLISLERQIYTFQHHFNRATPKWQINEIMFRSSGIVNDSDTEENHFICVLFEKGPFDAFS